MQMAAVMVLFLLLSVVCVSQGFIRTPGRGSRGLSLSMQSAEIAEEPDISPLATARKFVRGRLGYDCPDLFAVDFSASGPASLVVGKTKFMTESAPIYKAMPDLDLRGYAFQADPADPSVVWFKLRPEGSISEPFVFNGEVYAPSILKGVEFPVETGSVKVTSSGKVTRLTTGYVADRLTGNTNGLTGTNGILSALGQTPAGFTTLPVAFAIKKFFGRNRRPVNLGRREPPLPAPVMISLAKQLLATRYGADDPSLLARNFVFSGPYELPMSKDEYLRDAERLTGYFNAPGFDAGAFNFVIDEFDANRVWLTLRASATGYTSAPEAVSLSFDDEGLCFKATAGYVADRESGNTDGLGGAAGFQASQGQAPSLLAARPIPDAVNLLRLSLAGPKMAPKEKADASAVAAKPAPTLAPVVKPLTAPLEATSPPPVPVLGKAMPRNAAPETTSPPQAPLAAPATRRRERIPANAAAKAAVKARPIPPASPQRTRAPTPKPSPAPKKEEVGGGLFGFLKSSEGEDLFDDERSARASVGPSLVQKTQTSFPPSAPKKNPMKGSSGGGSFNLFGGGGGSDPAAAPKGTLPTPTKAPIKTKKAAASSPPRPPSASAPKKVKEESGGFTFFGATPSPKKKSTDGASAVTPPPSGETKRTQTKEVTARGGFALFGGGRGKDEDEDEDPKKGSSSPGTPAPRPAAAPEAMAKAKAKTPMFKLGGGSIRRERTDASGAAAVPQERKAPAAGKKTNTRNRR